MNLSLKNSNMRNLLGILRCVNLSNRLQTDKDTSLFLFSDTLHSLNSHCMHRL